MKIGILLPLSKVYPGIGQEFMDGLQSYLKLKERDNVVSFQKEGIGFGADEKDVYQKAEKLLISDDVDVLVAYLDEKVLYLLYPLVQATGKLMIVVNPGANYPLQWVPQPTVIRLNLQHAFMCWLSGALAAKQPAAKAALASSYYDCGYLHAAAIVNKFMEDGGTLQYNYINNQLYDAGFDVNALQDFLRQQPDCENLLCVFDEKPASLFYRLLAQYEGAKSLHLFTSPMMLQQKALPGEAMVLPFSVNGYLPWYPGINSEANALLVKHCSKTATMFTILGWEAAMVLMQVSEHAENSISNGEAVVSQLLRQTIMSPRGELKLDPETLFYVGPAYRYQRNAGADVAEITAEYNIETAWKLFTAKPTEGHVTGWLNTYLCY